MNSQTAILASSFRDGRTLESRDNAPDDPEQRGRGDMTALVDATARSADAAHRVVIRDTWRAVAGFRRPRRHAVIAAVLYCAQEPVIW